MPVLTHSRGLFRLTGAPKPAGWSDINGVWVTSQKSKAAAFARYADDAAKKKIGDLAQEIGDALAASSAITSNYVVPAPDGLTYRPYQRAGIEYAMQRHSTLIADGPRLGKTIQTAGVANAMGTHEAFPALIVSPSRPKTNWQRELKKWTGPLPTIIEGTAAPRNVDPFWTIINYDILHAHQDLLHGQQWGLVAFDEAHKLMSPKSRRTQIALGPDGLSGIKSRRRLFLTGTPIFTRPRDLFPIVRACDPRGLGRSWSGFAKRYCAADAIPDTWDPTGASNLEELQVLMRQRFMVRREKHQVQDQIPSSRNMVVIPRDDFVALIDEEHGALRAAFGDARTLEEIIADEDSWRATDDNAALDSVRQQLALAKVPFVLEHIENRLQDHNKVVVFAHHRAVCEALNAALPGSLLVYGGTTRAKSDAAIDRFAKDPDARIFIGNIAAMGEAIHLAVADLAVYAELVWIPSQMEQSEERIWDVGKTRPIETDWLLVEDSLDDVMSETLQQRMKAIKRAMSIDALEGDYGRGAAA